MDFKAASSVLFVKDMAVSRKFYEGVLGLQVEADFGENIGYVGGLAIMRKEYAHQVIFGRQMECGSHAMEIYLETAQIDEAVTRLQEYGVHFIHPVREQPWAQRVMRFYDPDEHIIEIGEPIDATIQRLAAGGMSAEQVTERTGMPLEIIKQILAAA
jgi:catechol 2,3-dioxygenase-like lactoylglutathione lyase family enzyme